MDSQDDTESIECLDVPNYIVCEILSTLTILMKGYYPLLQSLIYGLLEWPNLLIVTSGACVLLYISSRMVCSILSIIWR